MSSSSPSPLRLWPGVLIALATLAAVMPPSILAMGGPFHGICVWACPPLFLGCVLLWWVAAQRAPWIRHMVGATAAAALALAVVAAAARLNHGYLLLVTPRRGAAAILLWWVVLSRAPLVDRLLIPLAFSIYALAVWQVAHPTMPVVLSVFALPTTVAVTVAWLAAVPPDFPRLRRVGCLAAMALLWGAWCLVRCDGFEGNRRPEYSWRWSTTAEEEFLAGLAAGHGAGPPSSRDLPRPTAAVQEAGQWPGFRGRQRDNRVEAAFPTADWEANPPRQLWQRPVGPAWSSFSLAGRRLFSQEQRGESEHVVCYDTETGEEIWTHANPARFYEVMAGVGPRATPTYHQGRIYALGATGLLDCLDASTGTPIWSRDLRTDADRDTPLWGFASSPLVVGSVVLVHAGGQGDRGVMAYHLKTGELAWSAPAGTLSYSSPHLWQAQGQAQVLMSSDAGLVSLAPDTGQTLWNHAWQTQGNPRIVQPHPVAENRVLLGTGVGYGTRLLSVLQLDGGWQVTEVWTSEKLKPYFNDFVVHQGAIYGFDGKILTCIDLETGARNWKGGRYGAGQLILLEASDLLLVISDKGEVVLVDADPTAHRERTRFQALLGKTWNHPVVSGGRLYVRNAVEAAGYDLFP